MGTQPDRPQRPVVVSIESNRPRRANSGSHRNNAGTPDDSVAGLPARKAAARLLAAVIDARTPLDGLTDHENGHPQYKALDLRDRGLVRAILVTALRYRMTISGLLARRLEKPLPANATALSHILHVAAAQILFLDIPDSAAVDLAVTHAKSDPRTVRFSGLVNGVLRTLARAKDTELPAALAATDEAPKWFSDRLKAAYGEDRTRQILAAHRHEAPVDFSVKADPELWAERLGGFVLPTGTVRVENLAGPVTELPGFADGAWWVQDAAASLPARLFGDVSGWRVADLCAAPGGKTAQLILAGANVTAVDTSKNRLARLTQNLGRLGLSADIVQADLLNYKPEELFDAVLLDAPCSSTGTVRRHPDVPWTKTAADVEKLADLQRRLLERAVTLVKPGGRIVFSNCSLDPLEGEALHRAFLKDTPAVVDDPLREGEIAGIGPFLTSEGTLRTTPADLDLGSPQRSGLDGFFAARMRRVA
ncbi:MAG: methyltransferase domain-containing protein [Mesorhizobium sp.]|nr:methyltransferase domain-containing protein [bacterium M00.F.Ca.ET.205.01.1.1]TGU54923.1 methyltransferase domain-containing protein [bacterium M00.F.Ca.ET.152.01.1.1]TGV38310.1 methyltransferase domain-containing protein [Mesorhizobium sp. M00.F.Ca.ET.186.01.1.1]TGZ44494.1 methyltransferase domain-containing protein [bacterium M00.F.Ca.ET.162.01.1.1]TJW32417.1 MAG: methyltransferase domain-containing protein [Mesorhizobium sp.]